MKDDPIVAEIRRLRQLHAESFDYDLRRIFDDLKDSEQRRDQEDSPLLAPPEIRTGSATARFRRRPLDRS